MGGLGPGNACRVFRRSAMRIRRVRRPPSGASAGVPWYDLTLKERPSQTDRFRRAWMIWTGLPRFGHGAGNPGPRRGPPPDSERTGRPVRLRSVKRGLNRIPGRPAIPRQARGLPWGAPERSDLNVSGHARGVDPPSGCFVPEGGFMDGRYGPRLPQLRVTEWIA